MVWVQPGAGTSNLPYPNGIALDSALNLYVADPVNQTVTKWSPSGQLLLTIAYNFNQATGGLQLGYPNGVAVDSSGNIWVADSDNAMIIKFSSSGGFISQLTAAGTFPLNGPRNLWIDQSGNLWAALSGSMAVVEFIGVAASGNNNGGSSSRLSGGAIAGITVGVVVGVLVIGALLCVFLARSRGGKKNSDEGVGAGRYSQNVDAQSEIRNSETHDHDGGTEMA